VRLYFELELLEDAILRGSPGRTSTGAGLDFVPGANLLGVAARRYAAVGDELAWDLFHGGRVRFGDARLVEEGTDAPVVPAPMAFHLPKGRRTRHLFDGAKDYTRAKPQPGYEPLVGQFGPAGGRETVNRRFTLRTAVDPTSGRALENHLFGVESLVAGAKLRFTVDIDLPEPSSARAADEVRAAFRGPIRLGRSRNAECGLAEISELTGADAETTPWPEWPPGEPTDSLVIWCASEVVLLDPITGTPTARPTSAHFGLGCATLDATRTFVRTTRWSPFNGFRMRPDVERVALKAGSVLTFTNLPEDFEIAECRARLERGVGLGRAEGLGRVMVHPAIFDKGRGGLLAVRRDEEDEDTSTADGVLPEETALSGDPLFEWVRPRMARARADHDALERAQTEFHGWFRRLTVRRGAPTRTQWAAVRNYARRRAHGRIEGARGALLADLFSAEGFCRRGKSAKAWFPREDEHTPGARLEALLKACDDAGGPLTIGYLAEFLGKEMQQRDAEEDGGRS